MSFLWPGFLYLLGLIPLILAAYIWILRRRRRFAVRYSSLQIVREALSRQSRLRRHLPLGLFLLVVNGMMVLLVAWLMPSFHIAGLWSAILAALIVGLTSWLANAYVGRGAKIEVWKTTR